jgi:hypothetical protein
VAGQQRSSTRAEARLWTGPVAHLVGGALDVLEALARYGLMRLRSQAREAKRRR